MTPFRNLLIVITALIVIMTLAAVANEGIDLITPFASPVFAATWQGQFNVDFTCYLILSGLWMAWRSGFSRAGVALGILAPPLGMLFFAPYLIFLVRKTNGDARRVLLGVHA